MSAPAVAVRKMRPIIMSGESVRATLDDRKTQTRRVITEWPGNDERIGPKEHSCEPGLWIAYCSNDRAHPDYGKLRNDLPSVKCGQPGDRFYVKETWLPFCADHVISSRWAYAADCVKGSESDDIRVGYGYRWRSSRFMPRAASRLTVELTAPVRVERLQDITEADAIAEGASRRAAGWSMDWSRVGTLSAFAEGGLQGGREKRPLSERDVALGSARFAYANIWNVLNRARDYSWESNPFVRVLTYAVVPS